MTSDYRKIQQDNIREYGEGTRHLEFLQRLYADRTHFILELLQNAEDAGARRVMFVLESDRLIVHHDGRPFNENDVRGICGVSSSTKEDDLTAIGKFGIGFKAVYAYTATPEIHSGDEHFRIRSYVRPEVADPRADPIGAGTVFVFPFDRSDIDPATACAEIDAGLCDLDLSTLLFLRSIGEVTVRSAAGNSQLSRERYDGPIHEVELIRRADGRVVQHQYWTVFDRSLDHVGHHGQRVEIAFQRAGRDGAVERLTSSPLVAYFPTDRQTGLGFLLQAPLRTTPARDNVPVHDPQNVQLVAEAATLLVDALERLRDAGRLGVDVLQALPIDAQAFPENSMLRPIFDAVREALRTRPLVPSDDASGHVPGDRVRLAASTGVRGLLSPSQLGALAGVPGSLYWQPQQLTRDRTRTLWDYLRQEVGVDEVDPEWIVDHLDDAFLRDADDNWLIRFYEFLQQSPALWREPRGRWDRAGRARSIPFVRLEDGTHVAPFGSDGSRNAYLPGVSPTEYPTVRRTIAEDRNAKSFLMALGLQEPDAVDEVCNKILPRYRPDSEPVEDRQHEHDLGVIVRALKVASGRRRADLVRQLKSTAFLLARNAAQLDFSYHKPLECYWPEDELEHYFAPCTRAWFVHERYEEYRRDLTEVGVAAKVRIFARGADPLGHVVLLDVHSDHRRGLNGFDPDLRIDGLEDALSRPDTRRSAFVWNILLAPRADRLRGFVESASRADYSNARRVERDTEPQRLATDREWLPAEDGHYVAPPELALDDLPPEFVRNRLLADTFHMVTPAVQQASDELGISVDVLRYLQENSKLVAKLEKDAAARSGTTGDPQETAQAPVFAADFPALLQDEFTKPAQATGTAEDSTGYPAGQVTVPAMRRERTVESIREAQAVEPPTEERFRVAQRKVWDGKDPAVRQFLLEQYGGRCQICDATFAKRDGTPYFEVHYLVSHTEGAWIGRWGDALCLCPTCISKFLYGEVLATDVLDQVRAWRSRVEGGDSPSLRIVLCGRPELIRYTEKHLLDLQAMVNYEP